MKEKLKSLWTIERGFDLMDVTHGFFMIKFDLDIDHDKAINGPPWTIYDHYLIVHPWTLEFSVADATVEHTLAWVCLPSLGKIFYDENVLLSIASAIGTPIKVDHQMLDMA